MSLQKRLVALTALLLVIGLAVADVVIYASVHSYLYGQVDSTLAQDEALAFNYVTFTYAHAQSATHPSAPLSEAALSRRVSTDVYVVVLNHAGHVILRRPSGSPTHPDPAPVLTKSIPVQQVPELYRRSHGVSAGRYAGTFHPDPNAVVVAARGGTPTARTARSRSPCPRGRWSRRSR